jgi:homoserine O-succinyltransferase
MAISVSRLCEDLIPRQSSGETVIAFVNNMPDAAVQSAERQFRRLLHAGSNDSGIVIKPFFFPELPRSEAARTTLLRSYAGIAELWEGQFDGLIVTGAQPLAERLTDEPYWNNLSQLIEWAETNTISAIFSCLSAHAAVLKISGISRQPLESKLSGIFECQKAEDHILLAGLPQSWPLPHSRYNDLPETKVLASGYVPLTTLACSGLDTFIWHKRSLFVFFQGHPEYDSESLLLEYIRDVEHFFRGRSDTYPEIPVGYFDEETGIALNDLRHQAHIARHPDYLSELKRILRGLKVDNLWRPSASTFYSNWLCYIASEKMKRNSMQPQAYFSAGRQP